jgi:hypothetical protein
MRRSFLELAISSQCRRPGDFWRGIRRAQKNSSGGYMQSWPRFVHFVRPPDAHKRAAGALIRAAVVNDLELPPAATPDLFDFSQE